MLLCSEAKKSYQLPLDGEGGDEKRRGGDEKHRVSPAPRGCALPLLTRDRQGQISALP